MSTPNHLRSSQNSRNANTMTSTIGGEVPTDGTIGGDYPRPALPPPLPPIARDGDRSRHESPGEQPSVSLSQPHQQQRASGLPPLAKSSTPRSPQQQQPLRASTTASQRPPSARPGSARPASARPASALPARPTSAAALNTSQTPSSRQVPLYAQRRRSSSLSERSSVPDDGVENLMPLNLSRNHPIEKFFVQFNDKPDNQVAAADEEVGEKPAQPRNDNELLLEQFAEYTDDDSFFSSSSVVIEQDAARLQKDGQRAAAVESVHETLQLRAQTNGRMPEDTDWDDGSRTHWIYQVHNRAIALEYSSFFIFPPRCTARVVVYNVMHHWAMEMFIFFIILGYSIFQATWGRYTAPKGQMKKPDHILWADVFYTMIYGLEIVFRLFASGFILHPRSFFRSMWHWLDTGVLVMMILECTWWQPVWNFTAWRLVRCIKCLTYGPWPIRMKLLAKSLLRSTNRVIQVCFLFLYFIFFFSLIGLQVFNSQLRSRCISDTQLPNAAAVSSTEICRPQASGKYWFYWGHKCRSGFTCVTDLYNPHFNFRNFDDIGHAMLSTWQVVTFQGWSSLMNETNDGTTVLAFLWYFATILVCTFIIPSLFLGVFIEKIEKTSRLYVLKQLDRFDRMITEQRQRLAAMVKLHDFVERDEEGRVSHYPIYGKQLSDEDTSSSGDGSHRRHRHRDKSKKSVGLSIHQTPWTDEQRVQLHLSLTRQREVAEEAERKRLMLHGTSLADQMMAPTGTEEQRHQHQPTKITKTTRTVTSGPTNFALGGRVGAVQHHQATCAIGASRQTELTFAQRQETEAEQLRFLDSYNTSALNASPEEQLNQSNALMTSTNVNNLNSSRMSRQAMGPGASVLATRESAGVVPNRQGMSVMGSMSRLNSASGAGMGSRATADMSLAAEKVEPQNLVIHDPEGGDFKMASSCWEKCGIIRNILHMFTEGYPRILTLYLWEHQVMTYRYGLTPLSYTNKYEEEALRKLRRRRAKERVEERQEMRMHGITVEDSEEEEDMVWYKQEEGSQDDAHETRWMREEGLVKGSMSPIRMARNIRENAPITVFNYIWYFFIVANAVFNASRFDTMPSYWEMGTFVAGVCFSVLFMLELIIRFIALGPGPFLTDVFCVVEATFMIISLFQLGFSRSNTVACFNWIRFLRLFRVIPIRPLRRVTRVLIHGFPDIAYAVLFLTLYMFMWLLLGMSFFGSRIGWIDYSGSDYYTRGSFDTFSFAAYSVAQAFSVSRDEWLYLTWSGMRVRGSYTCMYFIGTVLIAFIFRFFFVAVFTYAWQAQEEAEDYLFMSGSTAKRQRHMRLPWFDFTVWRSFKHIHGGFERRDVAPDEVYVINEDMRRQLRFVEAKDRMYKTQYGAPSGEVITEYDENGLPVGHAPQYINVGGRVIRQPSLGNESPQPFRDNEEAQLRFARHAVPATEYAEDAQPPNANVNANPNVSATVHFDDSRVSRQSQSIVNPLISKRHSLSPGRQARGLPDTRSLNHRGDSLAGDRANNTSVAAQLTHLGKSNADESVGGVSAGEMSEDNFEHLLLPGPRLRYKSVVENGRRSFERCLDCNTHKQMPLRAPPCVLQRTADELHAEHCHMCAVRASRQLVLNALIGYARLQEEHEVRPTRRTVETVLGQAWSCGMLLFETIENMSCMDLPDDERTWERMIIALEIQQWVLGLHVGEEQVGRATLAYILAHQKKQERITKETTYKESWQDYTFFALSPSNPFRRGMVYIVESWWFEAIILFVIFGCSVCLAVFAPGDNNKDMGGSHNGGKYKALHVLDDIFTIIFAVELLFKWVAYGIILPVGKAYFWHRWNIVDCFLVIISFVSWGIDRIHLRYLKVLRCFRILGPLRYWKGNEAMAHIALTIWDSIPVLANVCLIMLMNYIVWAILFVSMFMNKMNSCSNATIVNGTLCRELGYKWVPVTRNFRNWYESLLTTVEISTGAEWMDVMYNAVDSRSTTMPMLTNRHPYLGLVFIAYYYLAHFVLFSLFMSGVIYCYLLAKNAASGVAGVSFEHQVWLRMQAMVLRIKPRTRIVPLNNAFSRGLHIMVRNIWFERFMGMIIMFNMVIMALEWRGMNHTQDVTLRVFQYVFVGIFTVEVIIQILAHGLRAFTRGGFCWDLFVMCLSYIQIGCYKGTTNHHVPFNVNVLRMLRVGRFLTVVNLLTPFETFFSLFRDVLWSAVPALVNATVIYMLSVYIFAVLGLHFLGYIVPYGGYIDGTYNNFQTFVNSLIMVFRLSTLENWATMLRGSLDRGNYCAKGYQCGPTDWAPVYYIPIVICFYLLLQSIYLAIIVDRYVAAVRIRVNLARLHDLRRFCELWSKRDPNGTLVLPTKVLPELLEELRLPLGISSRHSRVELLTILREYDIPDRNGKVHYYEVLLPLARRVMAMAFHENEETASQSYDLAWRLSERSLVSLPSSMQQQGDTTYTAAEVFAATYVQAAFRRDRAMRNRYLAKSKLWREGRAACDNMGLPYAPFGFGATSLGDEDPRKEGALRGFYLPDSLTDATAEGPTYAAAAVTAPRGDKKSKEPTTLLPTMYRSAIQPHEKRFGPDAPNAIRRGERRSDKLDRKRNLEDLERQQYYEDLAQEQQQQEAGEEGEPEAFPQEGNPNRSQEMSAVRPPTGYHVDQEDPNYQPPLGTDPEQMREEELVRRSMK